METIIHSISELSPMRAWRARRGVMRIALRLDGVDADEIRKYEQHINRDLRSCGCETGAVFVAAGIVVSLIRLAARDPRQSTIGTIVLLFALAVAGKAIGILFAEWRLRRAISEVIRCASACS